MILKKPTIEMTRHIRPLYVRAHFNGKPVSKVLVDNGLVVNVMPLRILRAFGRSIGDFIEIEVFVSAFTGEISMTLDVLPIDITMGNKTSLSSFFVINSIANYNALLGRDLIHANWCVSSYLYHFLLFWKGDELEMVWADKQPFITTSDFVKASYYDQEFAPKNSKTKEEWDSNGNIYGVKRYR